MSANINNNYDNYYEIYTKLTNTILDLNNLEDVI